MRDGTPAVVLGSLNKWTLNMPRSYIEVTAFGDTNKVYVPDLQDVGGTIGGFYDMATPGPGASDPLFDAAEGDVPVKLGLVPDSTDATRSWEGLAYLDVSVDVAVNGAVTITGNFKGAGPWTRQGGA